MDTDETSLAIIIIAGPQASGKSTLATAMSAELRRRGERVALVELDQIAAMALPTLPSWDAVHQIFETATGLGREPISDPTRGVSKEQSFLSRVYQQWPEELNRIDPDLLVDMGHCTVEEAVEHVNARIRAARR